jgi:hypothetical protein
MRFASNRYLTLLLLLAAAAISYAIGFAAGVWLFLVVGVIFELSFWVGLFTPRR